MILDSHETTYPYGIFIALAGCRGPEGSNTGLIIYPGGLVGPHAYVELASRFALSGDGHHVIIAKMQANLAVMDINASGSVDLSNWSGAVLSLTASNDKVLERRR